MKQFNDRLRRSFETLLTFVVFVSLSGFYVGEMSGAASGQGLAFAVGDTNGPPGVQVLALVQVKGFSDITTFQFSFHYDPAKASFVDMEQFDALGLVGGNFDASKSNQGIVTVSWDDPLALGRSLTDGTTLFAARLLLTGEIGTTNVVAIDSSSTPLEVSTNFQAIPTNVITLTPGHILIIPPNTPPVLTAIGNRTVTEGSLLIFTNHATDAESPPQTLTYSLDPGALSGMSINATNGVFTWIPTEEQGPGSYQVIIRVTDSAFTPASAVEIITITVNESNAPPNLAPISDKTTPEGIPLKFTVSATDPDVPAQLLICSLGADAPAGATINPTNGLFSWTPPILPVQTSSSISIIVTDNGSPALSATQTFTVTVVKTNHPPAFAPLSNYLAQVLLPLKVTNMVADPDVPTNRVTFSLDAGPKGIRINKFTGVVIWVPARSQAHSTNLVSVYATDDGVPQLSATNSFQVVVDDYLELSLGRLVLRAGDTGSVPITVTNTTGVTNLSSALFVPPDLLTNLSLSNLASGLDSGVLQPQGEGLGNLSFNTANGQAFQPVQALAQLNFTAIATQSVFVPLLISNVTSFQTNGLPLSRTLATAGRVVVVANEPLIEALTSTNQQPLLVLYGQTGSNYIVQASSLPAGQADNWQTVWQGRLTNLFQVIELPAGSDPGLFYRSFRE